MDPVASPLPSSLGKYRIDGILGEGAMGVVYRAFDAGLERRVAIKTIRKGLLSGPDGKEVLERFKREASAGMRLSHKHVVRVYEFGEENEVAYIVMEFIDGQTLHHLNKQRVAWPLLDALDLANQLLIALDFFHERGVVHRDIKPANIMIDGTNNLIVTDFGIAHTEASELTQVGTVLGTPSYMSPEQITGTPVDGRSDLFSVGVVLYEMLTGTKPFRGQAITIAHNIVREPHPDPSTFNTTLPPAIDRLFLKALAKRPEHRFQNGAEFREALRQMVHAILHGDDDVPQPQDVTLLRPAPAPPPPSIKAAATIDTKIRPTAAAPVVAPVAEGSLDGKHRNYRSCPKCHTQFTEPRPWNAICSGCGVALLDAAKQAAKPPSEGISKLLIAIMAVIAVIVLAILLRKS